MVRRLPRRRDREACKTLFFAAGLGRHITAHFHIEEHAFPGLVDAQGRPLLVDVGDHLLGRQLRIDFEIPHAAIGLFDALEQVIGEEVGTGGGEGDAEHGVDPGGHKVMADGRWPSHSSTRVPRPRLAGR